MSRLDPTHATTLALLASLALSACASYEKCGFGGCAGDAELAAHVRAAFADHAELQPPNLITVQSVNHVVYLYGLVDTDLQLQTAEALAHEIPGVTRVVNSIGIAGNSR